jgi:excisionase family DNA binding protein
MERRVLHSLLHVGKILRMSATLNEPLLNVRAAAELLSVSARTVYELVARDELPHVRVGGQIRFVPTTLEQWLRNGGKPAP